MAVAQRHWLIIFASLAVVYMLIPIAVIIGFSFNDPAGRYNFTWAGFTLEHWKDPFAIEELTDAMITSLELAALATLIATALGTLIALALVRYEFFGRKASNFLIVIPIATPEVVIGAALLSMFLLPPFATHRLGFPRLVIAHVMFSISFVVIVVRSRLIGFDRSLEEAARDLGAERLHDLPDRHPAADHARDRRRRAARVRALDRRLRDLELQLGDHGHLPALHLRRRPARHPGRGQRDRDDAVRCSPWSRWCSRSGSSARAEKLAAIRPDQEGDPALPTAATATSAASG